MLESLDIRAILWGLALGDAIGLPTEFKRLTSVKRQWGPRGIQEPPNPAMVTDDTQLTIALGKALVRYPTAPIELLMREVSARFVEWLHSPDNNRAPGTTCITAIRELDRGAHWEESGLDHSKGAGSAMRVACVGYLYQHQPDRLYEVAQASSLVTHRHPTAVASAIGAAYLIKLALDGYPPLEMIEPTIRFVNGLSVEFDSKLRQIRDVVYWEDEEAALATLGEGWNAEEAVALALYCCTRNPRDWVATVRRGANSSGDSDSVASIAGGIQAARLGVASLPQSWLDRLERRDEMMELANNLARAKANLIY